MAKRTLIATVGILIVGLGVLFFTIFRDGSTSPEQAFLRDILRLQNMQIGSFDPLDAYHAGHIHVVKQLYNTLVDIDLEGKPIPSLAKSWTTTDGKAWTFTLRQDVSFVDDPCFSELSERRFNAEHVKYSFERLMAEESQSMGVPYFLNIAGAKEFRAGTSTEIAGISVTGKHVIEFNLVEPDYSFPSRLTLPYASIVSSVAVRHYGADFSQHPVGTGPFLLVDYEPDKQLVFRKNGEYWEREAGTRLPQIDGLSIALTTDDNRALLMFKDGLTDFLEMSRPMYHQFEAMQLQAAAAVASQPNPQLNFYLCNLSTLDTPAVRRGISRAVQRSAIQQVLSQEGTIARSLFPPALFPDVSHDQEVLRSDRKEAKRVLKGLPKLRLVCFEDVLSRAIADVIAGSLKECGVETGIEAVPFPVLVERLTNGQYDLVQLYWGPLYADPCHYLSPFLTSSIPPAGNNFNKYSNAAFDTAVAEAQRQEGAAQLQAMLRAEQIILEDMPFLLLYFKNTVRASSGKFDMPLHPLQYRLYKLARAK